MKTRLFLMGMGLVLVLFCYSSAQVPQMMNYQGKLTTTAGAPVNATVQMVFSIYADAGGTTLLWRETQTAVVVDKGVFNVLLGSVDPVNNPIPYSIFDGSTRYLGVKVGGDPDEILPRKPIVSVAYAYKSFEADTADFARSGGGGNDWIIDASDGDTTLFTGGAWGIARYGNILYGNADSTHVNLGVACTTGTSGQNYNYCTVGGGFRNAASGYAATVGGGDDNTASSWSATAGGGHLNTASGSHATVGGGEHNAASGDHATVGGGDDNTASGADAAVGGGESNSASGWLATVGGGYYDTASGYTSTIGGGYYNTVTNSQGTIAGGGHNYASGGAATIAGGYYNTAGPYHYSTVGGGERNTASAYYSTVPGGYGDTASGYCSFAAGYQVKVSADYTLAFGYNLTTSTPHAVIFHDTGTPIKVGIGTTSPTERLDVAGTAQMTGFKMPTGASNGYVLTSDASGVGTWQSAVGGDNDWIIDASDGDTTLFTGGAWGIARYGNTLYGNADSTHVNLGVASTTGSYGLENYKYCTVSGGVNNRATHQWTTVGGGEGNQATGKYGTVAGGQGNVASGGYHATVGGGVGNTAGWAATVGGGGYNAANGLSSTVGGGLYDTANGEYATVPGGYKNTAGGDYSFAVGREVKVTSTATYTFAFGNNFTTSASHAVIFHDTETPIKVGIGTTNPQRALHISDVMRLEPRASAPASPSEGDIYVNSTDHHIYCYLNGVWKQLDN